MKKISSLIIVFLLITFFANAQIQKGSIFLGGDIGGSTLKATSVGTTTISQNSFFISPVFGKAIKENLILGVDIGIGINVNGDSTIYKQRNNSYGAGIFIRKYKPIGKSGFYIFLQGRFGVDYNYYEDNYPLSNFNKITQYNFGISAYPGISYTVSKRLQLETGFNYLLSLNYYTGKTEYNNPASVEKTNGINISANLNNLSSLYVGFRVLINK